MDAILLSYAPSGSRVFQPYSWHPRAPCRQAASRGTCFLTIWSLDVWSCSKSNAPDGGSRPRIRWVNSWSRTCRPLHAAWQASIACINLFLYFQVAILPFQFEGQNLPQRQNRNKSFCWQSFSKPKSPVQPPIALKLYAGAVNGVQGSLCSLFASLSYMLGTIVSGTHEFKFLMLGSAIMVLVSAVCFTWHCSLLAKQGADQRRHDESMVAVISS